MKKLARIYALILIIGIVFTAAGYAMGGNTSMYFSWDEGVVVTQREERVLKVDEPLVFDRLVANLSTADITIRGGDAFSLEAVYRDGNEAVYELNNGTLTVSEKHDMSGGVNIGYFNVLSNKIVVTVPKGVRYDLISAQNHTGSTTLQSLEAKEVSIDGDVGDVSILDVRADRISTGATTGSIRWDGVDADSAVLNSHVGDIRLENVNIASLTASTNTGGVTAQNVAADAAEITGAVGDIRLNDWTSGGLTVRNGTGGIAVSGTITGANVLETNVGDIRVTTSLPSGMYTVDARSDVGDTHVGGATASAAAEHSILAKSSIGNVRVDFGK